MMWPQQRIASSKPSLSRSIKAPSCGNCTLPSASRASGAIKANGPEARRLLAPVYGWFTEGFDTPVLQDTKALLDQLA
jgi:hypothetical protein